jgi:hypothetical protein
MSKHSNEQTREAGGGLTKAGNLPLVRELTEELEALPVPVAESNPGEMIGESEMIRPEDLAYTHSVFVQCFMPVRHNEKNQRRWQTDCGNTSLVIRAGELIKPESRGEFKECSVPAGPKARIVVAYINDYAYRRRSPLIDLGDSMREFMRSAGIPVGGKNGKELQRELENFAAAEILLGVWRPGESADQQQTKVAQRMSFWIDKNPEQKTLWQPEMTLSKMYYDALMHGEHIAPIHWPANIALQSNPRAMDVLNFLTYRLHKPLPRPVLLHVSVLHAMFGGDVKSPRHFWPRFLTAMKAACKHYPDARIEVLNDAIKLYNSPALIPYRKVGRIE